MEVSDDLKKLYGDYYLDENVLMKRRIAARQTLEHLNLILPRKDYRSIIDIGAGDGSLLEELDKSNVGKELHAVEISESGCACIKEKKLGKVRSINQFDGYNIPVDNSQYELGIAIHVLEHVEHERMFIQEMARTCQFLYIEVPFELTLKIKRNIRIGAEYGHINYYTTDTFKSLLESCNLEIITLETFSTSIEYESFLSGPLKGAVKHALRSGALNAFSKVAPWFITYMGGAYCKLRK
jgi:2-polyprenyl-3-methyl-5-hydroxy-6-metoxy-1,4-benzoquinol methylase